MTKQEFRDIWDGHFNELISVCNKYGMDFCKDVCDARELDYQIRTEMMKYKDSGSWLKMRDELNEIYDRLESWKELRCTNYYLSTGGGWRPALFEDYRMIKKFIFDYMDKHHLWDEEEGE